MNKKKSYIFSFVLVIALLSCPGLTALTLQQQSVSIEEETGAIGRIAGKVYGLPLDLSGPEPVPNATVYLIGGTIQLGFAFVFKQTTSDMFGNYDFNNLPIGRYVVLAMKPGTYLPGFRHVKLTTFWPQRLNVNIFLIRIGGGESMSITYDEYVSEAMTMIPHDQQVILQESSIEEILPQIK